MSNVDHKNYPVDKSKVYRIYEEDGQIFVECDAGLYHIDKYTEEFATEVRLERLVPSSTMHSTFFTQEIPGGDCLFTVTQINSDAQNVE